MSTDLEHSVTSEEEICDSLAVIEKPVKLTDPKTKVQKEYILREADGEATTKYNDARVACSVFGPNGKVIGLKNVGSLEPLLVSLCLFDSDGKNVPIATVKKWPGRLQKRLYNEAKRMSCLEEESKERDMLERALMEEGSPVDPDNLYAFVQGLGDEYQMLKSWLIVDKAASLGNSPSDTTAGSS